MADWRWRPQSLHSGVGRLHPTTEEGSKNRAKGVSGVRISRSMTPYGTRPVAAIGPRSDVECFTTRRSSIAASAIQPKWRIRHRPDVQPPIGSPSWLALAYVVGTARIARRTLLFCRRPRITLAGCLTIPSHWCAVVERDDMAHGGHARKKGQWLGRAHLSLTGSEE